MYDENITKSLNYLKITQLTNEYWVCVWGLVRDADLHAVKFAYHLEWALFIPDYFILLHSNISYYLIVAWTMQLDHGPCSSIVFSTEKPQ